MTREFDSPESALDALLSRIEPVSTESIALRRATDRVLASAIVTDRESPACDVSAMDGFAVRAIDLGLGMLPIAGEVRIGKEPPALTHGTALRIVTGAPVPPLADAIVRREDVIEADHTITIDAEHAKSVSVGKDIRRRGENAEAGELVLERGVFASASRIAALSMFGASEITVHRPVRVEILVTGDELVDAGPLTPFQIRDGNGPALAALFSRPWLDVVRLPRAPDDRVALEAAIADALVRADALVLTGGVSMGVHDYVPDTLRALGVEIVFHTLPQRPGKPILGGIAEGGRPVLALPGNPVSVLVSATRIALPALARRAGLVQRMPPTAVELEEPIRKPLDLHWYRPVTIVSAGRARITESRGSGDIVAAARSDGFVEIPPRALGHGPFAFRAWGECT